MAASSRKLKSAPSPMAHSRYGPAASKSAISTERGMTSPPSASLATSSRFGSLQNARFSGFKGAGIETLST